MINEKGIKGFLKQRAHCYHFTLQQQVFSEFNSWILLLLQPNILRLIE